jgi:hypothetical protein
MSSIEIVSPDRWISDGTARHDLAGAVLLHDPFSGDPLLNLEATDPSQARRLLDNPPDEFATDDDLGGGFAIWRAVNSFNGGEPLSVGVLLTEPSDPQGLGALQDLRTNMSYFSAVGYANKRSIRHEAMIMGCAPGIGSVTMGGEIVPDNTYMDTLLGVAAEQNKEVFSFDPEVDPITGSPIGRTALGLYKVEMAVRAEAVMHDPAGAYTDLAHQDKAYCNALQWHGFGRSGNELGRIMGEFGMMPPSVLLVAPREHGDLARKVQIGSVSYVQALFAHRKLAEIPGSAQYALAMQDGWTPKKAPDTIR